VRPNLQKQLPHLPRKSHAGGPGSGGRNTPKNRLTRPPRRLRQKWSTAMDRNLILSRWRRPQMTGRRRVKQKTRIINTGFT